MRNRAKCKLCKSIIAAKDRLDYVSCACGEITIDCATGVFHANIKQDKSNLILLDDDGNEIVPKEASEKSVFPGVTGPVDEVTKNSITIKPTKQELIEMLDDLRLNILRLPQEGQLASITNYDLSLVLTTLVAIFRSD